jgi:plastocyanin
VEVKNLLMERTKMKRKNMYKVGLSLLVAALFIFSAVTAIAKTTTVEKGEASDTRELTRDKRNSERRLIPDAQSLAPPNMVTISGLYAGSYELSYGAKNTIPSGSYPITVELYNDGGGPALVKAFCEIYKKCCGEYVLLYETSFEDNFDIYNNWMQIDLDCGMDPDGNVGFFDTWTWTDARAYCEEHSMKNTMYDIYKGNQDDYLMCTKSFDVRDQYGTKVNFKIWVEGQGDIVYASSGNDIYSVWDYLDFEVGDHNGNWVNPWNVNSLTGHPDVMWFLGPDLATVPGGYNFHDTTVPIHTFSPYTDYCPKAVNLGGGWWDVTFDVPNWYLELVLGLDLSDIMFRFSWHSDPQFQFEGAYVDCFEVWSAEDCEIKIFQSHSQGPFEVPPCDPQAYPPMDPMPFKFPLIWDAEFIDECGRKETCYDIVVWIQVLDPMHWTPHDWVYPDWWILEGNDPAAYPGPQDYLVCVGDYFDICVENLLIETSFGGRPVPPEGVMYEGEDAHIMADIHVMGTIPAEDITIRAYAEEKQWEEIFFTDCENMMPWGDSYGFVHNTNRYSWSGSKSIGFFDQIENEYPNDGFTYILGPTVDFSKYEEVLLDYYAFFATETNWDYLLPCLLDPYANYVLGYGYHAAGGQGRQMITGWSGLEWYGPMQPRSWYQTSDLMGQYNHYVAGGFLRTPQNEVMEKVQIGFYFSSDAPWYGDSRDNHNSNQLIGWSGVCLDDISIRGLKIGDIVWEDQIIIPGPCEPSETCAVQFEWEDVPFSNYKITVEDITEGKCGNYNCGSLSQQILVITELERAHPKEVESIDLTGTSGGPWGRCTSDYDYYLSTNPDSIFYDPGVYTATLCPDGTPCLDISEYFLPPAIVPGIVFSEDFATCPGGWTTVEGIGPNGVTWACDTVVPFWASPGGATGNFMLMDDDAPGSASDNLWEELISPPIDCTLATNCVLDFDGDFQDMAGWGEFYVFVDDGMTRTQVFFETFDVGGFDTHPSLPIDISTEADGKIVQLVFVFSDDDPGWGPGWAWGALVDNIVVSGMVMASGPIPPANLFMNFDAWWCLEALIGDFVTIEVANCIYGDGPCCGDDGYCCPGQLTAWTTVALFAGSSELIWPANDGWGAISIDLMNGFGPFNPATERICVRFVMHGGPIGARGFLVDDLEIVEPSIPDTFFGPDPMDTMDNWCFDVLHYGQYWEYDAFADCCGKPGGWFNNVPPLPVNDALVWETEIMDAYEAYFSILLAYSFGGTTMAYLEISDNGGTDWFILGEYMGSSGGCITEDFNLNFWVGKPVLIRVRVVGGGSPGGGFIQVCDMVIVGKEDDSAPTSSIQMSGTMKDSGWYSTAVKVKITATDTGSGVREIHVILDGQETVYPGDTAEFTVNGNGYHDISYYAVDNVGNVEATHTVPTFKIDAGQPPTVAITAPEPGVYLFGNKILSSSNVFIIGAFTIEANAEDADSGIYKVAFYLNDNLLGEDTEAPYSQYVAVRHMGAGTIKVVAEDFAQNVAEDTLDIKYFKFF